MGPRLGFCLDEGDKELHWAAREEVAGGQERQTLEHRDVLPVSSRGLEESQDTLGPLLLAYKPCSAEVLQKGPEGLSPSLCSAISYDPLQISVFSRGFKD